MKPVLGFVKKFVAPVVLMKKKILNASNDELDRVLPGLLGQFANAVSKTWETVGNIVDN